MLERFKLDRLKSPRTPLTASNLDGFRATQRLAYDCALAIAREIQPGWTEKRTAQLMDTYLRDHGVKAFFHRSFAWFGDRARFSGFKTYFDFLPSERRLAPGEVVILDTAPIGQGFVADIGHAFALEPHEGLERAMAFLREMRAEIPKLFSSDRPTDEIWRVVDRRLKAAGFANCHEQYPFSVLGHQVHHVPLGHVPGLAAPFGWQAYWSLLSRGLLPELLGPKSKVDKRGLWAIEPHVGGDGFGAKFEEILVVDESGKASWLDDEVPHVTKRAEP